MTASPDFSIIVPGYNEEHAIEDTITQIREVMQTAGQEKYELVVVNDCSTDGTGAVLDRLKQADPSLVVV